MSIPDSIEREIVIAAPVDKVWDLVSVPGWWINKGTEIDFAAVGDAFDGELVSADPPRSVTFRWQVSGAAEPREAGTGDGFLHTLVAFTLGEVEGGTLLSVVESGFSAARMDEASLSRTYQEHVEGWGIETALAKSHVETPESARGR